MESIFSVLIGLAIAQSILYRVSIRLAVRKCWLIGFFYFLLNLIAAGIRTLCSYFSVAFYALPLYCLTLALLLVLGRDVREFPPVRRRHRLLPDFYVLSGVWMGALWMGPLGEASFLGALIWAFAACALLPVVVGIRERLQLSNVPVWLEGVPILLLAGGILLLGLLGFAGFMKP